VVRAGTPVELSDLDRSRIGPALRVATERIMADITDLLGQIRGETPPRQRFDPAAANVATIGNPRRR
jgi:hypothetical protein